MTKANENRNAIATAEQTNENTSVVYNGVTYAKPDEISFDSWKVMTDLDKVDCVRLSVYRKGDNHRLTAAKALTKKLVEDIQSRTSFDISSASVSLVKMFKAVLDRNDVPGQKYLDTFDYPITKQDCKSFASQANKAIKLQIEKYLVNSEIDGLEKWERMLDNDFVFPSVEVTEKVDGTLDVKRKNSEFSLVRFVELTKSETVRDDFTFLSKWCVENIIGADLSDMGISVKSYLSQTAKNSCEDGLIKSFSGNSNSNIMYQLSYILDRLLPKGIDRNDKVWKFTSYDVNLLKKAMVSVKARKVGEMQLGLRIDSMTAFYKLFIRIIYHKVNGLRYSLTSSNEIHVDKNSK